MSAKRGRKPEVSASRKRQLSSDAKIILAFLKKQPQELREICESTKISDRTFYRVSSFFRKKVLSKLSTVRMPFGIMRKPRRRLFWQLKSGMA
jgi:hypothetical protein